MIRSPERFSSISENTQAGAERQPLQNTPSSELDSSRSEQLNGSDKTIDDLFGRIGKSAGEGYFKDPDKLLNLTKDAIAKTPKEVIAGFRDQINAYKALAKESYRARAESLFEDTRDNVKRLTKDGLVGSDVVKVFLDPQFISDYGRGVLMNQYEAIQTEYSRREEKSWMDNVPTFQRLKMRERLVADSLFKNVGDVDYQGGTPYVPNKNIFPNNFIHVNSKKPREKGGLRCYITADKTKDPGAVLYAWNESFQNSPLKDSLYFKFATPFENLLKNKSRPDDIVIYKTDNIDDGQFKKLLQDFQKRCNEMSPDILPSDEKKMPATTQKIANGISISGEPGYVNDYLKYTDHNEGRHSWTTFIDKMALLSTSIAANRLGVRPDSAYVPGLQDEIKKVFREFMLLSKINPDTMLPEEYGHKRPSWANIDDIANSDVAEMAKNKNEEAVKNKIAEQVPKLLRKTPSTRNR